MEKKPMRYGHSEGHTDVSYNETGQYILTCGTDGDVRIWQGIEDDDPQTISIAEKVNALAVKNGRLYTSSDTNTVQAHTFPDGSADGIVTRFTAPVNHMNLNKDATVLLAGADDFGVKLVTIEDSSQKVFIGHEAPILSVSLDPKEEYVASSSCDGTVKVWKIKDQNCEKSLSLLPKCSDISISKTLCRISWQSISGKYLAIPVEQQIQIYERDTWDKKCVLEDSRIDYDISISLWSVDGNYVIGTTLNGGIYVWDWKSKQCIQHVQHDKKLTICGIAFHPMGKNELVYTDLDGQLGLINNILPEPGTVTKKPEVNVNSFAGLFDDDDDGDDCDNAAYLAAADAAEQLHSTQTAAAAAALGDDDNDDIDIDDLISQKPKHRNLQAIIEDDNSMDSRVLSDAANESDVEPSVSSKPIKYDAPPQTPLQKSFQPASTPIHLSSRFMVWNSVGIIKAYSSDDENSIEIEFHDTSLHHAMHVDNNAGYTMASLSSEAVLFAAPSQDDNTPSQLMCLHFSSWDNQKEWNTSLPKDEEITALTLGYGWVAVATDKNFIRLFSVGGFQYEVFSIAGPIVTMAGHGSQLLVVYHMATGIPGDQCLGLKLMHVTGKKRLILSGDSLPISPKSTLTWLGFSAEGSPVSVDSSGVVRMLNRSLLSWTPVANTKTQCKSRSDNYWVIGVHENPLQLRCILCKGSRFPATLPRPTVSILQFQIPLCEMTTDKGKHEEEYWRSRYFSSHYKYNKSLGYETDEIAEKESHKKLDNTLMKLFALACKTDRDFRGAEIAELMSDEFTISLAIKYASRLKKMSLAQYLSQLAQQKSEEDREPEDEFDGYNADSMYSQADTQQYTQNSSYKSHNGTRKDDEEMYMDEESNHSNKSEDTTEKMVILKPKKVSAPKLVAASQGRKNPFKVTDNDETGTTIITRGSSVFDSMKKTTTSTKQSQKSPKGFELKPTVTRQPRKMQATLFQKKNKQKETLTNGDGMDTNSDDRPVSKKPTMSAFQMWFKHNKSSLQDDHPELDEDEIMKVATQSYRKLTTEEKKEWGEKAKKEPGSQTAEQSDKKRKREENNEELTETIPSKKKTFPKELDCKTKKPLSTSTNAKLAGFAYNKD
ncbi:WD repeat and HMG-box DNA-binding protein 1-like [Saccoglossus kowalevskii]|uniref:WD repeat and HMG-box DNA-binding protein 1-like n=1 Tax=Saccoglossus kowalevskii TaxID=10224 RepID=A0ABM0MEW7_SACKO|nr:PREDICTED: WD repeat and HMG-box DNA-binding protein 1-like [Saccoglossus kowalevskii]